MRSALAYRPSRAPLQSAGAPAALVFTWSLAFAAFASASPLVFAGAGAGVAVVALRAGATRAFLAALRWGAALGLVMIVVNGLVAHRGNTVLARLGDWPLLGRVDVTLESLAEGATIALRVVVVLAAFAVYSACVDPDRVLRLLRPLARRSALTATLVARMVPLAAADATRLRDAAALRGPGAAPAGRAVLARRLVAGSLDRAIDAAATLELRGYARVSQAASASHRRSRHDRRFLAAGLVIAGGSLLARIAGVGDFHAYPDLSLDASPLTLALVAAIPLLAWIAFPRSRRPHRRPAPALAKEPAGA
ncbi:MAG: energy-coupling factor transport system permease protein [Solirubrobacterales bacterium]|nr:energy-coupling factor transport system permease protein [Solirubrobacterales bacterium]